MNGRPFIHIYIDMCTQRRSYTLKHNAFTRVTPRMYAYNYRQLRYNWRMSLTADGIIFIKRLNSKVVRTVPHVQISEICE